MENSFVLKATGFNLALKSCLLNRFFRRLLARENKKKLLCWGVSWAKKNVCCLLTSNNKEVKKKWLYRSFCGRHLVILVNVLWQKVVFFYQLLLVFFVFVVEKTTCNVFCFSFVFFLTNNQINVWERDVWKLQHFFETRAANYHENAFFL